MSTKAATLLTVSFLGLVWGSSFILMKYGLKSFDAFQVAAMRLGFAGLIAWPFIIHSLQSIKKSDWKFIAIAGFIGNFFPAFFFTYAQQENMSSSLAGALNALTPLFTLLVGYFFFHTQISKKQVAGVLVGLSGALILIFGRAKGQSLDFTWLSLGLVILATVFYGINVNTIKTKLAHLSPITAGMGPLSVISIPAYIVFFAFGTPHAFNANYSEWLPSLLAVAVLGLLGTGISLIVFNKLIKNTTALFASSVTYLLPFVAIFWGILDKEVIGVVQILSMVLILLGIYLTR